MFDYSKSLVGKYKKHTLWHARTKTGFSIVPGRGSVLTDLSFGGQNIVDGYRTAEELDKLDWMKNVLLFPFPNRLEKGRYTWLGKPYEFPINDATTGNALHGFAFQEKMEVKKILLTTMAAEITCGYEMGRQNPAYPFPHILEVTFGISVMHKFRVEFTVTNLDSQPIPFGIGWHPYFRLSDTVADTRLRMAESHKVEIDGRMLPTGQKNAFNAYRTPTPIGEEFLDNCFKIEKDNAYYKVQMQYGQKKLALVANSRQFPFVQLFTPPNRQTLAVEPMTCNINALHNHEGLIKLPPGGVWRGGFYLEASNF